MNILDKVDARECIELIREAEKKLRALKANALANRVGALAGEVEAHVKNPRRVEKGAER